jgi:hypothetical protein
MAAGCVWQTQSACWAERKVKAEGTSHLANSEMGRPLADRQVQDSDQRLVVYNRGDMCAVGTSLGPKLCGMH